MISTSSWRKEANAGGHRRSFLSAATLPGAIVAVLACAALVLAPAHLRAQAAPIGGAARVTILPASDKAVVGSPIQLTLRIDLSPVTGQSPAGAVVPAVLGAYVVRVSFDPTLLRFDSASGGPAAGYSAAPVFTVPSVANANGSVTLTAAQTGSTSPIGLAPVAILTFQALNHGVASVTPAVLSLSTSLLPGPPPVGLVSIPGSGTAAQLAVDVSSGSLAPQGLGLDLAAGPGSNGNGILEPGEQVLVSPSWKNLSSQSLAVTGSVQSFSGPAGATYGATDASASYGSIASGAIQDCLAATGNCYALTLSAPSTRPAAHWDAFVTESASTGDIKSWPIHIGKSFSDVPTTHLFYKPTETIFHNGITGGCGTGVFCPNQTVTRAQMAVFLLKGKLGSMYVPPVPSGTQFVDVPSGAFAAGWIEDLAGRGITSGCGGGKFCPDSAVNRASMAVLLLRVEHGSTYAPPPATGMFSDVPISDGNAKWIEQLAREGVTGGCGGGKYCPDITVTRGQMAAFLTRVFKLAL